MNYILEIRFLSLKHYELFHSLYALKLRLYYIKFYKQSVETLRKLKEIQPNNPEVEELLNKAEKANNDDLNKEKKMFKKMFKYSD